MGSQLSGRLTSRLEGSTANKEAVNIRLGSQLLRVLVRHRSTIEDAGLLSSLLAELLSHPLPDSIMSVLRLLSARDLSSSNSPNRLIRNHNLAPVLDDLRHSRELPCDNLDRNALLPLLERLSNAENHAEATIKRSLGLGSDKLIRLVQDRPALRVAEDNPVRTGVLDLVGCDLAGEGALALVEDVLGSDANVLAEEVAGVGEVEGGGRDNDLFLGLVVGSIEEGNGRRTNVGVELCIVQGGDDGFDPVPGAIHLEVTADKELACSDLVMSMPCPTAFS